MAIRRSLQDPTTIEPGYRVCTKCKVRKELEMFPKEKRNSDGRKAQCKECCYAFRREWYKENREYVIAWMKNYNTSHKEWINKRGQEYYCKNIDAVRAYDAARKTEKSEYHRKMMQEDCGYRERHRLHAIAYRTAFPEKVKASLEAYRSRPEVRERQILRTKQWRAKNKERRKAYEKRYQNEHRDKFHMNGAIRRAREKNAPLVEKINRKDIAARDNWKCHLCNKRIDPKFNGLHPQGLTIDHLVPLSKGGNHTAANVAAAHRTCNTHRGAGYIPAQMKLDYLISLTNCST